MSVWERERDKVRSSCTQAVVWLFSCLQLLTLRTSNNVRFFVVFFVRFCILKLFFAPSATTWIFWLTLLRIVWNIFWLLSIFIFILPLVIERLITFVIIIVQFCLSQTATVLLSFLCENCVSKFVVVYMMILSINTKVWPSLSSTSEFCHIFVTWVQKGTRLKKFVCPRQRVLSSFVGKFPFLSNSFWLIQKSRKCHHHHQDHFHLWKISSLTVLSSFVFLCLQTHTKFKIKILTLLKKWKISAAF